MGQPDGKNGISSGEEVIGNNSPTTGETLSLTGGEGLQNIEKPKPEKLSDHDRESHRKPNLNQKESGDFIEDDALRILAVPEASQGPTNGNRDENHERGD